MLTHLIEVAGLVLQVPFIDFLLVLIVATMVVDARADDLTQAGK